MWSGSRARAEAMEQRVLMSARVLGQYSFNSAVVGISAGFDVAVAEGKSVVVGQTKIGDRIDLIAVRYRADGRIDDGFGAFGSATVDVHGGADSALAVVVAGDGKIVIAGQARRGTRDVGVVLRLNADGSRDETFGADGVVTLSLDGKLTRFADVAVWKDRIVVAGVAGNDAVVARFNSDGTLDESFDDDGVALVDLGGQESAGGLAVDADGRIVMAGWTDAGAGGRDIVVLRYRSDGTLDRRFSEDGQLVIDYAGGLDGVQTVVVNEAGEIYVGGTVAQDGLNYMSVLRLSALGRIDRDFGHKGWFVDWATGGEVRALTLASDGALEAAGVSRNAGNRKTRVAAAAHIDATGVGTVQRLGVAGGRLCGVGLLDHAHAVYAAASQFVMGDPIGESGFGYFMGPDALEDTVVADVAIQNDGKAVMLTDTRRGIALP